MCASRGEQDFSQFIRVRPPDSTAYMRHTYQSPDRSTHGSSSRERYTVPSVPRQQTTTMEANAILTPDSFSFKSPTDLASYIRQRHPGLERSYCIDYIKNQNALMMKDIFELRSSIIRHNAHLVDWLADNFGAVQMQMVHKKPRASYVTTPDNRPITLLRDKGPVMPVGSRCTPAISKPCHTGSNLFSPSPAVSPRPHSDGTLPSAIYRWHIFVCRCFL